MKKLCLVCIFFLVSSCGSDSTSTLEDKSQQAAEVVEIIEDKYQCFDIQEQKICFNQNNLNDMYEAESFDTYPIYDEFNNQLAEELFIKHFNEIHFNLATYFFEETEPGLRLVCNIEKPPIKSYFFHLDNPKFPYFLGGRYDDYHPEVIELRYFKNNKDWSLVKWAYLDVRDDRFFYSSKDSLIFIDRKTGETNIGRGGNCNSLESFNYRNIAKALTPYIKWGREDVIKLVEKRKKREEYEKMETKF